MDSNPNLCLSVDTAVTMFHELGPEQLKFTKITTVQYSKAVSESKPSANKFCFCLTVFFFLYREIASKHQQRGSFD